MTHLTNSQKNTIEKIHQNLSELIVHEGSGHDFGHILRVVAMAKRIIPDHADLFEVLCCAYLHELYDDKMQVFETQTLAELEQLWKLDFEGNCERFDRNIRSIGYKGGFITTNERSLEASVVSDADLLDAMGTIGIARTYYYAGHKGLPFHDMTLEGRVGRNFDEYRTMNRNAIAHFDEKLLHLYDSLVNQKAHEIGKVRHQRLLAFYEAFNEEIQGIS